MRSTHLQIVSSVSKPNVLLASLFCNLAHSSITPLIPFNRLFHLFLIYVFLQMRSTRLKNVSSVSKPDTPNVLYPLLICGDEKKLFVRMRRKRLPGKFVRSGALHHTTGYLNDSVLFLLISSYPLTSGFRIVSPYSLFYLRFFFNALLSLVIRTCSLSCVECSIQSGNLAYHSCNAFAIRILLRGGVLRRGRGRGKRKGTG